MDMPCDKNKFLRIAGVVKESIVDGPGLRYVVFTQGCPHHCEDCHNPQTHDFSGGKLVDINAIAEDIRKNPLIKGITISGGEPFFQAKTVSNLIDKLNDKDYNFMVYTGYEYENLLKASNEKNSYSELLKRTDILMDGKFDKSLKDESLDFRGSSNQRAIECKNSMQENNIILHNF